MPSHVTLKPLEANLTRHLNNVEKIHPYFVVALGQTKIRSQPAKKGGRTPEWEDAVSLENVDEKYCRLKLKTKRALLPDKTIGVCEIDLAELNEEKRSRWYDVVHKNKIAGRILIEGSILTTRISQSANALDERREPLIDASENTRQVASLGNLGQMEAREGVNRAEFAREVENKEKDGLVKHQEIIRTIEPIADVEDNDNNEIEKDFEYSGTNKIEENQENQQEQQIMNRDPRHPIIIIQRDSVVEDIPVERTEDEEISGIVKFTHNM